jgi:predicted metal-binding protein
MKAGIIRCRETEDICPGTADFLAAAKGTGAFRKTGPVEIVGYVTCGGCPGKRAVPRALELAARGAGIVALASCMSKGNPIRFPCPHFEAIRKAVARALPDGVRILDWTH